MTSTPTEALYSQLAGVSYSAQEDRRMLAALASPGVVNGLKITAGAGRNITVGLGTAIVSDAPHDGSGCYAWRTPPATRR